MQTDPIPQKVSQTNQLLTVPQLFANSDVNSQVVVHYLLQKDIYYKEAVKSPSHPMCLEMIQHADRIDAEVRSILAGNAIRLTRLYRIIDQFIALNPPVGRTFTALVLGDINDTLLLNEWYELLPRFEQARDHVYRRYKL